MNVGACEAACCSRPSSMAARTSTTVILGADEDAELCAVCVDPEAAKETCADRGGGRGGVPASRKDDMCERIAWLEGRGGAGVVRTNDEANAVGQGSVTGRGERRRNSKLP